MKTIQFIFSLVFLVVFYSSCGLFGDKSNDGYFEIHITINGTSEKAYPQDWEAGDMGTVIISWTSSDLNAGLSPNPNTPMAKDKSFTPDENGDFTHKLVESIPENGWIMVYSGDPTIPLQDSKVFYWEEITEGDIIFGEDKYDGYKIITDFPSVILYP